jgi:hypothetical protein
MSEFNWDDAQIKYTPKFVQVIADERGITEATVAGLLKRGFIGGVFVEKWKEEAIAFPVHDDKGRIWRAHCRRVKSKEWTQVPDKNPEGRRTSALVYGAFDTARRVYVFESQWDAITFIDIFALFPEIDRGEVCLISTRGANTYSRLTHFLWSAKTGAPVYTFGHNDDPGRLWLEKAIEFTGGAYVVETPAAHSDLGEWAKNGGVTAFIISSAIAAAVFKKPATPNTEADPSKNGQPPEWLLPKKTSALSSELPPQVLKGVLYKGCRIVFGGSPKAKKTWFLLQCCYCIGNGLPLLEIGTLEGKVVYLNFELLEAEARDRLFKIQEALCAGDVDQVDVIQLRDRRLEPNELEHLKLIISDGAYVLAAFDPVYKLMDGCDERIGKEVAPILAVLATIGGESKASIGYAQHFAKGNQKLKFAIDRISGSNYFVRDADVILVATELVEPDCFRVDIIQRSFPDLRPFGIRWQYPIFVRDEAIDIANIREPGEDKEKTDPVIERMLAALHASNFEGGLTFTEYLRAVQVKGKTGNPTPARSTFALKLNILIKRKLVEKSVATDKYLLTAQYEATRAKDFDESEGVVQ